MRFDAHPETDKNIIYVEAGWKQPVAG